MMSSRSIVTTLLILTVSWKMEGQNSAPDDQVLKRSFFERGKINGNVAYITGRLSDFEKNVDGSLDFSRPVRRLRNTVSLNLGINIVERVYFRTSFYCNLNKNINAPWLKPDYSYTLERAKWDANSYSYGYMNYELNNYSDNMKTVLEKASKGFLFVRYYNRIPNSWIAPLRFDSTASMSFSILLKYAIRYQNNEDKIDGNVTHGKPVASLNLRYVFLKNIYIEGTVLSYLRPESKIQYDPDFTYSFGYNSYTNLSFAFSYGNYSVNRFPWNEKKIKGYGFLDGQFSVMLNFSW